MGAGLSAWLGEKEIWMACVLLFVSWKTVDVEKKGRKAGQLQVL